MDLALAIEFEGSRIALGVVNRAGKVLETEFAEPDDASGRDPDLLAPAVDRLRARIGRHSGDIVVAGVAVGGGDDFGRDEANDASTERLRVGLVEMVGVGVHADSDGRAFALSEGWVGAAKGVDHYAALKLDEAVSGGIVLDGRMLDGGVGRAGRLGHVIVVPDGRRCVCGARGCLQAEVSIAAIESSTGRPLTEPSYDVMRHVGSLVGRAAASVANLLDLKLVVCGGRVAREYSSTMYLAAQEELDASCRLSFSRGARIVSARTPEPAGLVGAAAIGWRGLAQER